MKQTLDGFNKKNAQIQIYISMLALFVLLGLNTFEIAIRMGFNKSLIWVQDISVLLMVWMVFCGFTKITYDKKDVLVNYFIDKLKPNIRNFIVVSGNLLIFIFLIVYTYYAISLAIGQMGQGTITADVPLVLYTSAVVVNGLSLILIYFINFIDKLSVFKNSKKGGQTPC